MTIINDYKKGTFLFPSDDDMKKANEFISDSMETSIIVDGSIIAIESIIKDLNDIQVYALLNLISVVMNDGSNDIIVIGDDSREKHAVK